jgi:hypothetical protein
MNSGLGLTSLANDVDVTSKRWVERAVLAIALPAGIPSVIGFDPAGSPIRERSGMRRLSLPSFRPGAD